MYIIKEGKIDRDKKYRYFKCPKCGCEFIADKTEWSYDPISFGFSLETTATQQIWCICQTEGCGKIIYRDFRFNPKTDYHAVEDFLDEWDEDE